MKGTKKNFFELFDLPISIEISADKLEINYKKLQKVFHPDKFVNASVMEQNSALKLSSQINNGYNTLKNIESRVEYVLTLKGFKTDDSETFKDKEFLIEQIEINDFIESLDTTNLQKESVDIMISKIANNMRDAVQAIKDCIKLDKYNEAWVNLSKLKFYKKCMKLLNKTVAEVS